MVKPVGALSKEESYSIAEQQNGQIIYRVYNKHYVKMGSIRKLITDSFHAGILGSEDGTRLSGWFGRSSYGYLFSNYFHALAYSLKVKDEAQSRRNHSQTAQP